MRNRKTLFSKKITTVIAFKGYKKFGHVTGSQRSNGTASIQQGELWHFAKQTEEKLLMNESNSNEYITENDVFSSCCTSSWHYKTKIIVFLSTLQSTTNECNPDMNHRNHKNHYYDLRFLGRGIF